MVPLEKIKFFRLRDRSGRLDLSEIFAILDFRYVISDLLKTVAIFQFSVYSSELGQLSLVRYNHVDCCS